MDNRSKCEINKPFRRKHRKYLQNLGNRWLLNRTQSITDKGKIDET